MATRSTIALEYADGTVGQIYCHWDGYLDHNGEILFNNYQDPFKVRELMDLGDVSSLGPQLGDKHDFDNPFAYGSAQYKEEAERRQGITTFYGRDRGETGTHARNYKSYEDYRANGQFEEYNYILRRDGNWYVEYYGEFDGLLKEAFEYDKQQREAEEA